MNAKLAPERVYKENRANWNANYLPENPKQSNGNWLLPAWNEPAPLNWNQPQSGLKNGRKVSAKQHYLNVTRYVAGPSTSLSSRYRKFCNLKRILNNPFSAYLLLILGYALVCYLIWQKELPEHFACLINVPANGSCGALLLEQLRCRVRAAHTYTLQLGVQLAVARSLVLQQLLSGLQSLYDSVSVPPYVRLNFERVFPMECWRCLSKLFGVY